MIDGLVDREDYFNVDVMILSPKFFSENFNFILEGCKFVSGGDNRRYFYCEQDVLNYLFTKKYFKLPPRFNAIPADLRKMSPVHIERAIYHYAGAKPDLNVDDIFNRLYFEYFLKTPWAKFEMLEIFGNLDKAIKDYFQQIVSSAKDALLHISNVLSNRRRAFFVDKNDIDALKETFKVKDDELIINASQPDAMEILLDEMNKSKGEKIFFVVVPNYVQVAFFLIQHDFLESVDFFNATAFLSERHGFKVNFDTMQIVMSM